MSSEKDLDKTLVDVKVSQEASIPAFSLSPALSKIHPDLEMYEIRAEIGRGTSGVVYEAVHKKLGRPAAIKMLHPQYFKNKMALHNFRKEAQILSRIKHENVASVYDFVEANGQYYIVMEFIRGISLSTYCREQQLSEADILHVMLGILEGIRYSHNKNILHLDLKPSNVILNEHNEPVIVDFGLSRFQTSDHQPQTEIVGTPFYMAPEHYTKGVDLVDVRADIYSLGVMFYQLRTQHLPFTGATFSEVRQKVISEEPPSMKQWDPKISKDLEAVVLKMMRKNVSLRYANAQAVIDDVHHYQNEEPVTAHSYPLFILAWSWVLRNRAMSGLIFLVLTVGITFLSYFAYKKEQQTPHWKEVFHENFDDTFSPRWNGFYGIQTGTLTPISPGEPFLKNFGNRFRVASFKKDQDLVMLVNAPFDENVRMRFQMTANPDKKSHFGFFVNATLGEKPNWGYLIYFHDNQLSLLREDLNSTPLWTGPWTFKPGAVYDIELEEVQEGHLRLTIDKKTVMDFQDFVNLLSQRYSCVGFFSNETDLEIDNLSIFQLNTAMLITPLDIGNRFFQLNRLNDAAQEYSRVITKYPKHDIATEAYYLRGLVYKEQKLYYFALRDFDVLLSLRISKSLQGKCLYQKGMCFLGLKETQKAIADFNQAMTVYPLPSLGSNIVTALVDAARSCFVNPTPESVFEAEQIFQHLMLLNIPTKLAYVDILKKTFLYYYERKNFEKAIHNIDRMITHYAPKKDLLAFGVWKKGCAYFEMAKQHKDPDQSRVFLEKALDQFKKVLSDYSEIDIYYYYAHEEIARVYRALGDFTMAHAFERKKMNLKDVF
jgi:serine/threonine protein kinase/tetratricopeptide (TPR) repeat protein